MKIGLLSNISTEIIYCVTATFACSVSPLSIPMYWPFFITVSMRLSQQLAKAAIRWLTRGLTKENSLITRQIMGLGKPLEWGSCGPKALVLRKISYVFERWSESSINSFRNHVRQREHGLQEEVLLSRRSTEVKWEAQECHIRLLITRGSQCFHYKHSWFCSPPMQSASKIPKQVELEK